MFAKRLTILARRRPKRKTTRARPVLLSLEELETRLTPAVISTWNWKIGNNNDWRT
jgi:hypothetical protein